MGSNPLMLIPQLPKAVDWQRKYLQEWRALIRAQREILDAQEHLLNQQEAYLSKLERKTTPDAPAKPPAKRRASR